MKRTSSLESPTMLLTGHASMVTGCKFNPEGSAVASCSHDKHVFLWNVQVCLCVCVRVLLQRNTPRIAHPTQLRRGKGRRLSLLPGWCGGWVGCAEAKRTRS